MKSEINDLLSRQRNLVIVSELGTGAFAKATLVYDTSHSKWYLAKAAPNVSDDDFDLTHELKAAKQISSKFVARIVRDKISSRDEIVIFYEYCEGATIEHIWKNLDSGLTAELVAAIGYQIARGLIDIHRKGIIH